MPEASIPIQGGRNLSPVKNREKYGNIGIWERGNGSGGLGGEMKNKPLGSGGGRR